MTTYLDLIRHGTPVGGNKYRGHNIDDPLSEQGWQQMWQAVAHQPAWDLVISSPLQRCQAFAMAYAERHGLQYQLDARLREVGFGNWEGKTSQQILADDPQAIRNFYHDPLNHRPAGAEPLTEFQQRVGEALTELLAKHQGQRLLLVTHAGVMRAAITHILGSGPAAMYRAWIGNAAVLQIKDDGVRPPTLVLT